jgi:hypothetical protein
MELEEQFFCSLVTAHDIRKIENQKDPRFVRSFVHTIGQTHTQSGYPLWRRKYHYYLPLGTIAVKVNVVHHY